ncbi:shikimate dehydrogenase [Alkalicella caledoniensis]|uniref:Shikimate dehydrogenase n=1 Tax=Alkalicella caledoniensis TaxID=2731377 RepID=A0A7G9WDH0_ALKCA|nr:shikimate dehydrogenase [Alkalicella caledoniensis]QNO16732.1 shikimate dehydrogenase [Alkalicella caledoniensis]
MNKYCLIGYPIEHSLSPKMHNKWFHRYGIHAHYKLEEVRPRELETKIRYLTKNYSGFNVTYPLKKEITPYLDWISREAKDLKSVNTVTVEEGKLLGYNTDVFGIKQVIGKIQNDHCYILGNGNMAKTVIHSINSRDITVVCRDIDKAKRDLEKDHINYITYHEFKEHQISHKLIINTLPLTLDIGEILLGKYENTLLDCNYKVRNNYNIRVYLDGLEILIHQGAEAFRIWTGKTPVVDGILD